MKPNTLVTLFMTFANRLRFRQLFLLVLGLFVFDLLVPDMIPMVDEIILGLLALLLAGIKKGNNETVDGNVIEGEVVDRDDTAG